MSQFGPAQDCRAQYRPLSLVLYSDEDGAAVADLVRAVRRDRGVPGTRSLQWNRTVVAEEKRLAHPFAERVQHRYLEARPKARALALVERSQDTGVGIH